MLYLGKLHLSSIYFADRMAHVRFLDLSSNELTRLGKVLNQLLLAEVLIVDSNKISSIEDGFALPSLRTLSIKFNRKTAFAIIKEVCVMYVLIFFQKICATWII